MPKFDGTGPEGKGPKTGRGLGSCKGDQAGRSRGQGRGLGLGRMDLEQEEAALKKRLEEIQAEKTA